jgi:hypothetical protein
MRIMLKQAVCINDKDYALGIHEIPESVLKHKFFHQLILSGKAVEAEAVHIVTAETLEAKQKKLLDKIMGAAPVEKVEVVEVAAPVEVEMPAEVVEDEQTSRKSVKSKRK